MNHGTRSYYMYYRCRCAACTEAQRHYIAQSRARRTRQAVPDHVHGTPNGYNNYGCRCGPCSRAQSDYYREYYQRRRA